MMLDMLRLNLDELVLDYLLTTMALDKLDLDVVSNSLS